MAASAYSILLSNGQTKARKLWALLRRISVYQAANQAVNSSPVCTLTGAAGSGTVTTDFSVSSPASVVDIVVTSALTAGGIEIYNVNKSLRTQRGWGNLETFLNTNTTRRPARVTFMPGQIYRFIQTVAGNA